MFWEPQSSAPRNVEGLSLYVDEQLRSLSIALDTLRIFPEAYVPLWTHTVSTSPSIGNGTLIAHAMRLGEMAIIQMELLIGSTTTFEATSSPGEWEFSVPWACDGALDEYVGSALLLDTGSNWRVGATRISKGTTDFSVTFDGASVAAEANVPVVWTTGDKLEATLMYPVRT